ncbi:Gfo/Idh/MocA family protein [Clostridium lacusfryxellense]|uniref:Gfo/Idh/MocA family protein n=1 Tax=Clostridium lacusfryxellense TaxID=205328 RepID=UPI001C0CE732|nr:Gfo/Idh/MocA family oxidoreductase [Clostridium lacusfryxellense]MBU3113973.1 Gfo/Idh/MocA family oxidoreductase [Clostridium lacusfryxellense]
MDNKIVNWGVLGCARIANSAVIPGIKSASNANLYAIASRSKEKLEEFNKNHNPEKTYKSYIDLLKDPKIDAVYIPLPNSLHCEWVIKAAENKKHILCEKPLGISAKEVEVMRDACNKNGVLLMEAFPYRHSPLTIKVKNLIDTGAIGKLKFIEANFSFILTNKSSIKMIKNLGGGATYDIGCYNINVIRFIAGSEPLSIFASGEIGENSSVDESSCIMMEFKDDLKAVSYCSLNSMDRCGYTIVGTTGIIDVPVKFNSKGTVKITLKTKDDTTQINVDCPDNYMLEVEQFGRCILGVEEPLVSLDDSYNNAKVIDESLNKIFNK